MKKTYISPSSLQFIMQLERIIATSSMNQYNAESENVEGWTNKKKNDPYDCIWMPKEK